MTKSIFQSLRTGQVKVRARRQEREHHIAQESWACPRGTLRKWVTTPTAKKTCGHTRGRPARRRGRIRLECGATAAGVAETHALSGLSCMRGAGRGCSHQLSAWREAFCASAQTQPRDSRRPCASCKSSATNSQRELTRKERALAETAALLVLQKVPVAVGGRGEMIALDTRHALLALICGPVMPEPGGRVHAPKSV